MNNTDWKDVLSGAFGLPSQVPDTDGDAHQEAPVPADPVSRQGGVRLDVLLERKGRAGKQATIITGFTCDDEALKQVASRLKRSLGVGGSARGGEILIQGDRRRQVLQLLTDMGLKARVI